MTLMGLYDTVRSSFDLGPGYNRKDLQTKDLECMMYDYWIDPTGKLYEVDYSHTQDFNQDFTSYVANGNHGKVKPIYWNGVVEVFPAKWDCYYAPFPSCFLTFTRGIITEVTHERERTA
jgi:hypothetical protein